MSKTFLLNFNSFPLDFNLLDHSFCEATIYGKPPEYINSFTSLFLSFIGCYGLMMNNKVNNINFIYSALIINGFCSFMYHYNNFLGWGLLDRFSMVLIAIPCYFISLDFIKSNILKKMLTIVFTFYLTILLTSIGLQNETLFNYLFGFFLISILFFLVYLESNNKYLLIPRKVINYGWKGMLYITLAGGFWILTEKLCYQNYFVKYLFGHGFWHFGVSYGGYLISLVPIFLYQKDKFSRLDYYMGIPYIKLIF